jgi:hypothetical protein
MEEKNLKNIFVKLSELLIKDQEAENINIGKIIKYLNVNINTISKSIVDNLKIKEYKLKKIKKILFLHFNSIHFRKCLNNMKIKNYENLQFCLLNNIKNKILILKTNTFENWIYSNFIKILFGYLILIFILWITYFTFLKK